MSYESESAVRARYADITARLDRELDRIQAEHDRKKAEHEARVRERDRRDAEFLAKREAGQRQGPPKPERPGPQAPEPPRNPWPAARRRPPTREGDGTETGYYSTRTWLE